MSKIQSRHLATNLFGPARAAWAGLRQWLFPAEFRIAPLPWPSEVLATIERLSQALPARPSEAASDPAAQEKQVRLLAELGTGLWRLRQKMLKPGTTQPLDEMRRAYRHLESTWDVLGEMEIEIQDHTDTPFDSGLSLRVIAFQPTAGITRERVLETIKPTVYCQNRMIQMGEVIVGTPETEPAPQAGLAQQSSSEDDSTQNRANPERGQAS